MTDLDWLLEAEAETRDWLTRLARAPHQLPVVDLDAELEQLKRLAEHLEDWGALLGEPPRARHPAPEWSD